jgi:hypothetical protein
LHLRLTIAPEQGQSAANGEPIARDDEGTVGLYGSMDGGTGEIRVPGLVVFRFRAGSRTVIAYPEPDADRAAVRHSFYATALPLIEQASRGRQAFHASGVLVRGEVVAFCGVSGAGKSTLAHGMVARGHRRWGEDAIAFQLASGRVEAVALPLTVGLREESRAWFAARGTPVAPADDVYVAVEGTAPFAAVFVLSPGKSEPPRAERLPPPDAMVALLPNTYRFRPQPSDRERETMQAYLALVSAVPVLRFTYRHDLRGLPRALEVIEGAVASLGRATDETHG